MSLHKSKVKFLKASVTDIVLETTYEDKWHQHLKLTMKTNRQTKHNSTTMSTYSLLVRFLS